MNKFYYFEGRIFETLEAVEVATKNYTNKQYEKINTFKNFEDFENEYDNLKLEGNSDLDAIEWAKQEGQR